jgi:DNA repair exonuclease SbcCD ATPase subunit
LCSETIFAGPVRYIVQDLSLIWNGLTLQISKLSSTPQSNVQKEELTPSAALKQEEEKNKLNQKLDHLSNRLESCTVAKNKAEKLAGENEESAKRSENIRRNEENSYKKRSNGSMKEHQKIIEGLNSKIAKLVNKADQLKEDLELQLAFQHNLDLKTTTPEALTAN